MGKCLVVGTKMPPRTRLKKFDLKVGDLVKAKETIEDWGGNSRGATKWTTWKVTGIYPAIFTVINIRGIKFSFQKKDYQLGLVQRIGESDDATGEIE